MFSHLDEEAEAQVMEHCGLWHNLFLFSKWASPGDALGHPEWKLTEFDSV